MTARIDFAAATAALGGRDPFDPSSLRVEALDGDAARGRPLPFRLDARFNPADQSYRTAGDLVFLVPDPDATRIAVDFGPEADKTALTMPPIGDGDLLRLAGDGRTRLAAPACYPWIVDFDGDGRRDLLGSDRYGSSSCVTWFRNVGTDSAPLFSDREVFRLSTGDGRPISNPNRGWLLTVAMTDWDADGKRDLLVGGWCRYLTFYKNVGTDARPAWADGKVIFDAKVFPGFDYGRDPDTIYQGVFIEPCDWDGDGQTDLLCGTYARGHIYFLRNAGRDGDGLPILAAPEALAAGGKPIDDLLHVKPSAGDWDCDGDLDLVAGQYFTTSSPSPGQVAGCYLLRNVGDRRHPRLAAKEPLIDAKGDRLAAGFHSEPTMVDWDKDGAMDVVVTGRQEARLYLNRGGANGQRLVEETIPCLGSAPCHVAGFAYPLAYDLDRDGTLDLVVGDGDGDVLFFKGAGGLRYAPATQVKSGGTAIHEVGCPDGGEAHCGYVKVAIADWNGDDHPDLIMWSNNGRQGWQGGRLGPDNWCLKFFPGTGDPLDFGPPVEIQADGEHIRAGYRCKPDVADLDGDGLLDLVVACGKGTVNEPGDIDWFKNVGTAKAWSLAGPVPLTMSDGRPPATPVRTAVRLADWDGDGDLDLITGNHGPWNVRFWENVGTATRPVFAPPKPWKAVNTACESHHEVGVDAVDLDGDGTLDLIEGNGDTGMIHVFRRAFLDSRETATARSLESKEGKTLPADAARPKGE